eukprot:Hpha_TRINITY_DN28097_c0_g1::TRINITY_DN28097_c0_g1_i1::g.42599::m.42599
MRSVVLLVACGVLVSGQKKPPPPAQPVLTRDVLRQVLPSWKLHAPFIGDKSPDVLAMLAWKFDDWLEFLSERKAKQRSAVSFIQVGANDGIVNDPLYPTMRKNFSRFVGLQVEPGTFNHNALITLHAPQKKLGWTFAKVVVTNKCEGPNVTFYEFPQTVSKEALMKDPDKLGVYGVPTYVQIGQTNGLDPGKFGKFLKPKQLPCVDNVVGLVDKYASTQFKTVVGMSGAQKGTEACATKRTVDLLQIDCEGHDWRTIAATNFKVLRPHLVHWEKFGPITEALFRFAGRNYALIPMVDGMNVLGVDLLWLRNAVTGEGCQY